MFQGRFPPDVNGFVRVGGGGGGEGGAVLSLSLRCSVQFRSVQDGIYADRLFLAGLFLLKKFLRHVLLQF